MKQICQELLCLCFFSDIKYADSSRPIATAHCRCNPRAQLEKCCAANLLNFHTKNAPKVNLTKLTTQTNIITLFMNTVKHFVKISTQKLEIIQRKVANRIDCCLPLCHFYLEKSVSYPMITNVHVSVTFEENFQLSNDNKCSCVSYV